MNVQNKKNQRRKRALERRKEDLHNEIEGRNPLYNRYHLLAPDRQSRLESEIVKLEQRII